MYDVVDVMDVMHRVPLTAPPRFGQQQWWQQSVPIEPYLIINNDIYGAF